MNYHVWFLKITHSCAEQAKRSKSVFENRFIRFWTYTWLVFNGGMIAMVLYYAPKMIHIWHISALCSTDSFFVLQIVSKTHGCLIATALFLVQKWVTYCCLGPSKSQGNLYIKMKWLDLPPEWVSFLFSKSGNFQIPNQLCQSVRLSVTKVLLLTIIRFFWFFESYPTMHQLKWRCPIFQEIFWAKNGSVWPKRC